MTVIVATRPSRRRRARSFACLVPGRCIESHVIDNLKHFYHINIHFFGLTPQHIKRISERTEQLQELARHDPLPVFIFVAGDLNLRFADKPLVHARSAVEQFKEPKYSRGAKLLLNSLRFFSY